MKAVILKAPGDVVIANVPELTQEGEKLLLRVRRVGLCGSDLNSYRGKNPLVKYPIILGHEVAATIVEGSRANPALASGVDVTVSPYANCGRCASCLRKRPNACAGNETLGVHRDGALTEYIYVPAEKLYPAKLSLKELCLVEPLTVGFHAVARARVIGSDSVAVFGCGEWGLARLPPRILLGQRRSRWISTMKS